MGKYRDSPIKGLAWQQCSFEERLTAMKEKSSARKEEQPKLPRMEVLSQITGGLSD